jgi:ABC-type multidrug transport system permease subunit
MKEIEYKIGRLFVFMLYFMAIEIYSLIMYHYTNNLIYLLAFIITLNIQIFILMFVLFGYIAIKEGNNA